MGTASGQSEASAAIPARFPMRLLLSDSINNRTSSSRISGSSMAGLPLRTAFVASGLAAGQGRQDTAALAEAAQAALAHVAAHLARGNARAALEALDAGSFPRALAALRAHLAPQGGVSPEAAAAEGAAA